MLKRYHMGKLWPYIIMILLLFYSSTDKELLSYTTGSGFALMVQDMFQAFVINRNSHVRSNNNSLHCGSFLNKLILRNILNTVLRVTCAAILLLFCGCQQKLFQTKPQRTNWLSEWYNDSLIRTITWLVPEWITIFEQIVWMNDSMSHS